MLFELLVALSFVTLFWLGFGKSPEPLHGVYSKPGLVKLLAHSVLPCVILSVAKSIFSRGIADLTNANNIMFSSMQASFSPWKDFSFGFYWSCARGSNRDPPRMEKSRPAQATGRSPEPTSTTWRSHRNWTQTRRLIESSLAKATKHWCQMPSAKDIPRLVFDSQAIDTAYFTSVAKDGTVMVMRIARRHNRKAELWLSLKVILQIGLVITNECFLWQIMFVLVDPRDGLSSKPHPSGHSSLQHQWERFQRRRIELPLYWTHAALESPLQRTFEVCGPKNFSLRNHDLHKYLYRIIFFSQTRPLQWFQGKRQEWNCARQVVLHVSSTVHSDVRTDSLAYRPLENLADVCGLLQLGSVQWCVWFWHRYWSWSFGRCCGQRALD